MGLDIFLPPLCFAYYLGMPQDQCYDAFMSACAGLKAGAIPDTQMDLSNIQQTKFLRHF